MRRRFGSILLMALLAPAAAAESPEEVYAQLRSLPFSDRVVRVSEFSFERDAFTFGLSGNAYLFQPSQGQEWGFAFVGEGTFALKPSTASERHHLRIRTGDPELETLTDTFEAAVFYATDETVEELMRAGELETSGSTGAAQAAAQTAFGRQRKAFHTDLQLRVLQDLLSGSDRPGVFIAMPALRKLAPVIASVDPLGSPEEVMLLVSPEETTGGFWYLAHRREELESGRWRACRHHRLQDSGHYTIDTTIKRNEDVEGTTTMAFTAIAKGERVIPLTLAPTLRIKTAERLETADAESGTPLVFLQGDKDQEPDSAIIFEEELPEGEEVVVRLTYAGDGIVTEIVMNYYAVGSRASWYPNINTFSDDATYDMTFRTLGKSQVLSVGEKVSEERTENGRVTRWKSDHPVKVVGFNFGNFEVESINDEQAGVTLEIYGVKGYSSLGDLVKADAINSARLFRQVYGELPFPRIAVSQQIQGNFGQSWPTLVYLPSTSFNNQSGFGGGLASFMNTVGAHEMAHQWWGHEVGWNSYRDQWLSEGFSTFSANYFMQRTEGWKEHDKIYGEQRDLIAEKRGNYRLYTVGPISMGWRLSTNRSPAAYSAITYYKGAFVLHMLRMLMMEPRAPDPDARFFAMMRDFVDTHAGGFPTTGDFQAVVEDHMVPQLDAHGNGSMDWFFDQWVHGTEIPTFRSDLRVTRAGKEWRIQGSVSQEGVSEDFVSLVPIYIDFGKGNLAMLGRLPFRGESTQAIDRTLALPQAPKGVLINAHHDVLSLEPGKSKKKR